MTTLHADTAALNRFQHIVIEGPIGVGKTLLARKLAARLGAETMLEPAEDNPFLDRFYEDMPGYAFQTQLFFLFQRLKQMQSVAQPGMFASAVVSDFLFAKDALYARLNLSDEEFRHYTQMYARVAPQVREPDLVVWLQASPAALIARVQRQALGVERRVRLDYLQRVCDAYVEYFHAYEGAPVFAFGVEHFDPVASDADFDTLLRRLSRFDGRREFFNSHVEVAFS